MRRVKVYQLNDSGQWDDKGTGHVFKEGENDDLVLVVRSEDGGEELLSHEVQPNLDYTRQGDTIITWCEMATSIDLALSFQEEGRCNEIWELIMNAQQNHPDRDINHNRADMDDEDRLTLPTPSLNTLDEIYNVINSVLMMSVSQKESLAQDILKDDYLQKLLDTFEILEDVEKLEGLHTVFNIFKSLFMLNDVNLFEVMLGDEHIMAVIAALEYDPDLPANSTHTRHRDFLKKAEFKHVIRLREEDVTSKVHQNFRMTYIKDVVLLRYLDDPTLSTLTSMIFFNNVMIVSRLSDNTEFMQDLFGKLEEVAPLADLPNEVVEKKPADAAEKDEEGNGAAPNKPEPPARSDLRLKTFEVRRDLFLFVQELCSLAKSLQIPVREAFYKTLIDSGIFLVLERALVASPHDSQLWMWLASIDILGNILNHDPVLVRTYMASRLEESSEETLLGAIVNTMTRPDVGAGLAHQLAQTLRMVLDPDSMQNADKDKFLDHLYQRHMVKLVDAVSRPFRTKAVLPGMQPAASTATPGALEEKDWETDDSAKYQACEMLSFCALQHMKHGQWSKSFMLAHNVLEKVAALVSCGRAHIVCSAIRFLRSCIGLKDERYMRDISKKKLLDPVMNVFVVNGARYNLTNSVILELIHFIRHENLKSLVDYLVTCHEDKFKNVNYVQTFRLLKVRYEQNQEYKNKQHSEGKGASAEEVEDQASEYDYFNRDDGSDEEDKAPDLMQAVDEEADKRFDEQTEQLRLKRKHSEDDEEVDFMSLIKGKVAAGGSKLFSAQKRKKGGAGAGKKMSLVLGKNKGGQASKGSEPPSNTKRRKLS